MNKHKNERAKAERGPTFVGLSPIYEKTRDERRESQYKKHKNRQIDPEEQTLGSQTLYV